MRSDLRALGDGKKAAYMLNPGSGLNPGLFMQQFRSRVFHDKMPDTFHSSTPAFIKNIVFRICARYNRSTYRITMRRSKTLSLV